MSSTSVRKPVINAPDDQQVTVENELPATRTRAKKNFKHRLSELDQKLNSNSEPQTNVEETKLITSPRSARSNSEIDDTVVQAKTKPRRKRATKPPTEDNTDDKSHVNEAYESDNNLKTEPKSEVEEPKKRSRRPRKKTVESNLNGRHLRRLCTALFNSFII